MKKTYNLSDKSCNILEEIKGEFNFKTEVQTLDFILESYVKLSEREKNILEVLERKFAEINSSINQNKKILQEVEDKGSDTVDMINSFLANNYSYLPYLSSESEPVSLLVESRKRREEEKRRAFAKARGFEI